MRTAFIDTLNDLAERDEREADPDRQDEGDPDRIAAARPERCGGQQQIARHREAAIAVRQIGGDEIHPGEFGICGHGRPETVVAGKVLAFRQRVSDYTLTLYKP